MSNPTMTCPKCEAEMNHQAEKLVHPVTREEMAGMTQALDGVILIVYACPECGWIDSVRETEPSSGHR